MSPDEAIAALEASRAGLRSVMLPPQPPSAAADANHGLLHRARVVWRYLRQTGSHSPVLKLAAKSMQDWWRVNPWRAYTELASPLGDAMVPLVRRHPWPAVALAAAAGAALVAARPWRWRLVALQAHAVKRQALGSALSLLTGPIGQAAIASLLAGAAASAFSASPSTAVRSESKEETAQAIAS